ncbi:hypothetical protein, partial [Staphylococcus aureus]|uniref:hypothetical protein n=1 Tax=Staphylococcus aureus TaxID=1280 RepID=UPI003D1F6B02
CWVDELVSGSVTSTQQIASREQCSLRQVNLTISLAFLSPTLVKAAVDGHLPRGIGISNIRDLPYLWAAQHRSLGLQAKLAGWGTGFFGRRDKPANLAECGSLRPI